MFMTDEQITELQFSDEYANYLMDHHDPADRIICNGDTLLQAQEDLYLFTDFLMHRVLK